MAKKCWTVSEAFYIQAKESGEKCNYQKPSLIQRPGHRVAEMDAPSGPGGQKLLSGRLRSRSAR